MELMKLNIQLFGASTSKTVNLYSNNYPSSNPFNLIASIVENSTSVNNNTSSITLSATFKANGAYWQTSYNSTIDVYWYDNKTNTQTWKTSTSFAGLNNAYDTKSVSTTFDVEHNADGTLSGYCRVVFTKGSTTTGYACNSGEVSTDWIGLTTIPRASSISATDCGLGDNTTITINRASNSFTHTLTYSFGSLSGTIATGVGASYTWETPMNFAGQIPNAKSGLCTINCVTYNSGTQIGTSSTTFKVTVEEQYYKPTVNGDVVDTDNTTIALTGDATKLIKGYSTAVATYNAQALASATITNVYINNVSVGASPVTVSSNYTNYSITVVDSRGYRTTETLTSSVISYIPLTISANFYRIAPTTGEVGLTFSGNYFDDTFGAENNTLTLEWEYKERDSQTWLTGGTLVEDTDYVIDDNKFHSGTGSVASVINLGSTFNYQKAYDFRIRYADKLIDRKTSFVVPKGKPIINWDDDDFNVNGNIKRNDAEFAKNSYSTSQDDTYSCDYLNTNFQNIEVLFNGTPTTGDVTLSKNAYNYNYLEIFYRETSSVGLTGKNYNSTKVIKPSQYVYANLNITIPSTSDYTLAMAIVKIESYKISKYQYGVYYYGSYSHTDEIEITKVIGYK